MDNPYYSPESFNLELLSFDEPGLSYVYNTLCFWATEDGQVYTAWDSGCSCPTPFERYEAGDLKGLLPQLERVGSLEQALQTLESWGGSQDNADKQELSTWIKDRLK